LFDSACVHSVIVYPQQYGTLRERATMDVLAFGVGPGGKRWRSLLRAYECNELSYRAGTPVTRIAMWEGA
jgi:hypothetical protein